MKKYLFLLLSFSICLCAETAPEIHKKPPQKKSFWKKAGLFVATATTITLGLILSGNSQGKPAPAADK